MNILAVQLALRGTRAPVIVDVRREHSQNRRARANRGGSSKQLEIQWAQDYSGRISNNKPLTADELRFKKELDENPALLEQRPRKYGQCMDAGLGTEIPCPFASCRYSLLVDVNQSGCLSVINPWWEYGGDESRPTCGLAESDEPKKQHEIGFRLGLTASSIESICTKLLRELKTGL